MARAARDPVVACLALALLMAGPAARAEEPFDLPGELTDRAGVVTSAEEVRSLQDRMVTEQGLQLLVVTVDNFSGQEPDGWLDRTAELSGLGPQDLVLVMAVRDGTGRRATGTGASTGGGGAGPAATLVLRVPRGTGLAGDDVDAALRAGDARLAAGDPDGAVVAVATGLLDADRQESSAGRSRTTLWLAGAAALLALAGLLGALLVRARR